MHATYFFLQDMDIDAFATPAELAGAADGTIANYADGVFDENNWWRLEGIVFNDNQVLVVEDDTPRLEYSEDAWNTTWRTAARAIAGSAARYAPVGQTWEWEARITDDDLTLDEIMALVTDNVPLQLTSEYAALAAGAERSRDSYQSFRRQRLGEILEALLESEHNGYAPFSADGKTPYEYRAFDLTCDDQANAIILADIHT